MGIVRRKSRSSVGSTEVNIKAHTYIYIYMSMYVYIYAHVCKKNMCIYAYIYTYIHNIYIYINMLCDPTSDAGRFLRAAAQSHLVSAVSKPAAGLRPVLSQPQPPRYKPACWGAWVCVTIGGFPELVSLI